MQTRRDQLQAYRYVIRRIMTSLLGSEPESPEQPIRRVVAATMSGIMVLVVAGGIVALVTWLSKSGAQAWQTSGAYVIEKETGARFVNIEGVLYPVENYSSARLIVGGDMEPARASRQDLAGAERGPRRGIPGAPDTLPDADHVTSSPWTVCVRQVGIGSEAESRVDVFVGETRDRFDAADLGEDALVVETPEGQLFLIWNGRRFATDATSLNSLGINRYTAVPVPENWINAVPPGSPLRPMTVPGRGTDSHPVGGDEVPVGDVLHVEDLGTYYVVLPGGIAAIHETEARLLLGLGADVAEQWDVSAADANAATAAEEDPSAADLPPTTPALADLPDGAQTPVCDWYEGGDRNDETTVSLGGRLPKARNEGTAVAGDGTGEGVPPADRVSVAKGEVAVVSEQPAPDVDPSGFFLVTDAGVRFPVPSKTELATLGYGDVEPVPVPGSVLDLVPLGPSLNADAANRNVPITVGAD